MSGDFPEPTLAPFISGDFFRIIPSRFPPIALFESIYDDPEEMQIAYEIEALTNPRIQEEVGSLKRVPSHERISGPGASIVMAPFTHLSDQTRFSDGSFGVYYAAKTLKTAIEETKYHRARFLAGTDEVDQEITMRVYAGGLKARMLDLRPVGFAAILDLEDYSESQQFARRYAEEGANGLLYPSVRYSEGVCVAVFRPKAVAIPTQRMHLKYVYSKSSRTITSVYQASLLD